MKRRRVRSKAPLPKQPRQDAMETAWEGATPVAEPADNALRREPDHETGVERQGAPGYDEALSSDAGPAGDQQAVHEIGADEWLDAEAAVGPPVEREDDLHGP